MQTITPALAAILKSKFQAAADGFRGRVEIDVFTDYGSRAQLLTWRYLEGVTGHSAGFQASAFNDSGWASGLAPFGKNDPGFAVRFYNTLWAGANNDLCMRAHLDVPATAIAVRLIYDVDLSGELYFNGVLVGTAVAGVGHIEVPLGAWTVGDNVVAVRSHSDDQENFATVDARITLSLDARQISIDKSLRMPADGAEVESPNEGLPLGWGTDSVLLTNARCRIYQWYGSAPNEVRTFTGVIDRIHDSRDAPTLVLSCRDMMAIAIDQTFGATAPQGAGETGAVRTKANGVYLSMEVSDIVADLLDRAGWPTADRAITPTSYVLDEYIIADGTSWADAIIGDAVLTGLVGYSAWADELGVFHFAPTLTAGAFTAPGAPAYTFRSGEDMIALDDSTDQYDVRTRCKIRGPLTTQTLTDTWRELWRTSKFAKPVGIWYDPADAANIRVIDRGTKRLYKLRQSDRAVVSSVYLGSVISSPLGISGDPSDATIYWVLNAPWIYTGSTAGNSVKKVRKSDNVVLATYAIPNGRWSAIKVSAAFMWLTNLDTDRFYKRSKVDASAISDFRHTYASVLQANPSGLMIDGTTLHIFWANGGTTARFLVCDEGDPGTITKVVKTAGTTLHGGEMNTTTHTECWGDSDSLGLVAKFTLVDVSSQTSEVFAEAVDSNLEDELGKLAQAQLRIHDTHPLEVPHAFEVRRETVSVTVVTSLAQATDTAMRRIELLARRRRVVDGGIIGNPALQKTDLVRVVDPVTGLAGDFTIDTYRSLMEAGSTYLGTLALIPVALPGDAPIDDGSAT